MGKKDKDIQTEQQGEPAPGELELGVSEVSEGPSEEFNKIAAENSAALANDTGASNFVEAFILRDCGFGKAGQVVELAAADAAAGAEHGMLDLHPDAISAAKNAAAEPAAAAEQILTE